MHLQIDVDHREGYTVLRPQGEIDFATGPRLKEAITERLVAGETHLVIDLSAVDFIESTGLGALIGGRRRGRGPSRPPGPGRAPGAPLQGLPVPRPGKGVFSFCQ